MGNFKCTPDGMVPLTEEEEIEWAAEQAAGAEKFLQTQIDAECARIMLASDEHDAVDLPFDFGTSPTQLLDGSIVEAGVRSLQMGPENVKDWQGQHQRAIAAIQDNDSGKVILVIVSDNAVVFATPEQFKAVFEKGAQRREANAQHRVQRKAVVRACTTLDEIVATRSTTDAGWPQQFNEA